MKKIILGLFLTVGVSGFALAGNTDLDNKSEDELGELLKKICK